MSLGLSHSLSRYKLKFSPDKVDTMIVQAIGLLDDLDKELNTYAMRVREWYGWHFPEMTKVCVTGSRGAMEEVGREQGGGSGAGTAGTGIWSRGSGLARQGAGKTWCSVWDGVGDGHSRSVNDSRCWVVTDGCCD